MSDTKVYQFGEQGAATNNLLASVIPALQNKGIDSSYLMGLMSGNNNGGFFGNNGGFQDIIALIVIAAIFGNGNFGFGNNGNNANSAERELIANMIQRNGVDLNQLASSLNCSVGQINNAIGQVASQICNLSNQVGTSSMQIINSIQAGNSALASQLASCCCETQKAILESNYLTERGFCNTNQILSRGFSDLGYATRDQTCSIEKAIADSTQQILAGQAAIEKRELQREIATLQEEKQTYKLGNMIAAATNPIAAEIESIKCRLPRTEVINATPEYVPLNRSINVPYAPYCGFGAGFGTGFGFGGWNGCQNSSLWG
jgi:hypothetical protein